MTTTLDRFIIQTDAEAVERFVEALDTLGVDGWEKIAGDSDREAATRSASIAVLDALITHNRLGVQAWDIADDVETATFNSLGPEAVVRTERQDRLLRQAHQAAKRAALALFVRPLLTAADFDSLYRPFASLLPLR